MKHTKIYIWCSTILLFVITLIACSESSEETYAQYLNKESLASIGNPIGVKSLAGTAKAIFKLAVTSDPRVTSGTIEWVENGETKTFNFDVNESVVVQDTITLNVNNIVEGINTFTFTLFDKDGKASDALTHTSRIYGPIYESELIARRILKMEAFPTLDPAIDSTVIYWSLPIPEMKETTLVYTDHNNIEQSIVTASDVNETAVVGYNRSVLFSYTTKTLPEPDALDSYVSAPSTGQFPKVAKWIGKSTWSVEPLSGDIPPVAGTFNLNNCWDGVFGNHAATLGGSPRKHHFTIDLGITEPAVITEFVWEGFHFFREVEVKNYQVWVTDDITNAETTADINVDLVVWETEMADKGWTKIIAAKKPKGNAYVATTTIEANAKYVRIVILDSYLPGNPDIAFGEISIKAFE